MRAIQHAQSSFGPVYSVPLKFNFSSESKFDGHSDFEAKSKVGGSSGMDKQITEWIENNDICVFMKGNRKMPRCGFSNYVVQIFKFYGVK